MSEGCGICLEDDISREQMVTLSVCKCSFCKECVYNYVEHEIDIGHLQIPCPSPTCDKKLHGDEIRLFLRSTKMIRRYEVLIRNTILATNPASSRCPFCDYIYDVNTLEPIITDFSQLPPEIDTDISSEMTVYFKSPPIDNSSSSSSPTLFSTSPLLQEETPTSSFSSSPSSTTATTTTTTVTTQPRSSSLKREPTFPRPLQCPNCLDTYCSECSIQLPHSVWMLYDSYRDDLKENPEAMQYFQENIKEFIEEWHECESLNKDIMLEYDIKKCPQCSYLIQRSGGCAQISCLNCSHVFCWHCLASLDSDFLLLHYDSGPCKNLLGHSRASIFFNRIQAIAVCVGVSALMILASPVILITLPCVLGTRYGRFFFMRKKAVKVNRDNNNNITNLHNRNNNHYTNSNRNNGNSIVNIHNNNLSLINVKNKKNN